MKSDLEKPGTVLIPAAAFETLGTVDETDRGISRKELLSWYSEWKKDDSNRLSILEAAAEEPPYAGVRYTAEQAGTITSALGEAARGIRYVGVGSEKIAFVYGNGLCLKLQTSSNSLSQTKREIETLERLNRLGCDAVPRIYGRNGGCTSLLCEACGICDGETWRRSTGLPMWKSFLAIHAVLANVFRERPSDMLSHTASVEELDGRIEYERDCWDDAGRKTQEKLFVLLKSGTRLGNHMLQLLDVLFSQEIDDWSTDGNIGMATRNGIRVPVIVDLGM